MKKYLSKLSFFIIGLTLATTASYLNAWSGPPTGTAPDNNVDSPINVGNSPQTKLGGIGAIAMIANEFCLGSDCITSWSGIGGSSVPAGAVMAFNLETCPAGWVLADGNNGTKDLRGYFIRGSGTNSDGTASGAFGLKQADDFKSHDHSDGTRGTSLEFDWFGTPGGGTSFLAPKQTDSFWSIGDGQGPWGQVLPQGGTETRPKNIALTYCQKDGTSAGGGSSSSLVKYGGSYLMIWGQGAASWPDGCARAHPLTGTCSCPNGYTASAGGQPTGSADYYQLYICEAYN